MAYNFDDTTVATVGSLNKVYRYLVNKDNSLANIVETNNTNIVNTIGGSTTTTVIKSINDAKSSIEGKIGNVTNDSLSTSISNISSTLKSSSESGTVVGNITSARDTILSKLGYTVSSTDDDLVTKITNVPTNVKNTLSSDITNITNSINSLSSNIGSSTINSSDKTIAGGIAYLNSILGSSTTTTVVQTIKDKCNTITKMLGNYSEGNTLYGHIDTLKNTVSSAKDSINKEFSNANSSIQDFITNKLENCVYYTNNKIKTNSADINALVLSGDSNTLTITGKTLDDGNITSDTTSGSSTTDVTPALYVNGGIRATSGILGAKVYNAVWNDISDAITVQEDLIPEPGYCYYYNGEKYNKTNKYCTKGILGIHSDTAGFKVGKKHVSNELDIAIGGYVLAHVDKEYKSGTPLTCTKNGYLTKMKRIDVILFPERLVATYWKPETLEEWGSENEKVAVNGRHWVKVI